MSDQEKEELMQQNFISAMSTLLRLMIFKYWTQTIGIATTIIAIIIFVTNTKGTNNEFPKLKQSFEDHLSQESINRAIDKNEVNNLALDVREIMVKIDDLKRYGRGEYHEETTDSISKIKRHRK